MPKTPIQSESTNRFNPYIPKSISKNLLTPCRQIGLSRKRKTPNSSTKSLSDIKSTSSDDLETTPVTSRKTIQESYSEPKLTNISENEKKVKKSVSKCLIVDDEGSSGSSEQLENEEINKNAVKVYKEKVRKNEEKNKSVKKKRIMVDDEDEDDDISLFSLKTRVAKEIVESKPKKKKDVFASDSEEVSLSPLEVRSFTEQLKKEEIHTSSTLEEKEKKSGDHTEDIKKKTSVLSETQNKDIKKSETLKEETKKPTKLKRSLSLKKSSDDLQQNNQKSTSLDSKNLDLKECAVEVTLLQLQSDVSYKINEDEIRRLEKQAQDKQKILDELKQAAIYKRLHNVDELEKLTATWKNGCISALNDLLPRVQAHCDTDMATLLKKLRVPEKLITLSQSGDLV